MRTYTVIGAGAIGLLYGTRLAAAGHRVDWVLRRGAEQVRRDGITVDGVGGRFHLPPQTVAVHEDPADAPPSDIVLVALKTTANDRLADLVAPAVAEGATVAVFQNGLDVEQAVRDAVPQAGPIVGALCFVCAHRMAPGVGQHLDYGPVTLGGLDGPAAATPIADDLAAAGIETTVRPDLNDARWHKLVWNMPFNAMTVILQADTAALLNHPRTRALLSDLMDEVIGAGNACGASIDETFRDRMLEMTDVMKPYLPSMRLDADAGRALEVAAMYDAPIAAARAAGAPMLRAEVLAQQISFLDRTRIEPRNSVTP